MLRRFLLLASILIPLFGQSQCFVCETYSDALKSPAEVRMLQLKDTEERPDERIAACENLQVLFWENAKLFQLPDSFSQLKNLTDLSLANNEFTELPKVLLNMKNLKVLNLQGNRFDASTKEKIRNEVQRNLPNTKLFL